MPREDKRGTKLSYVELSILLFVEELIMKRWFAILCFSVVVLHSLPARSGEQNAVETNLRRNYEGKLLSLKHPCIGRKLEFDPQGKCLSNCEDVPWTTGGLLRVKQLNVKPGRLEIRGNRVIVSLRSDKAGTDLAPIVTDKAIDIDMKLNSTTVDSPAASDALARVFAGGDLDQRVRDYWRPVVDLGSTQEKEDREALRKRLPEGIVGYLEGNRPVYLVNPPSVSPPKAIHTPDPEYTTSARQKRVTGTAKIMLVISDRGRPEIVQLTKDLGEGLDVRALTAVSQWSFHPSRKGGQPVASMVWVEMKFDLY
jgi:TonB family protein